SCVWSLRRSPTANDSQQVHGRPARASRRGVEMEAQSVAGPIAGAFPSRWQRIRGALTRDEWLRAGALAAAVLGLHVVGFFIVFALALLFAVGIRSIAGQISTDTSTLQTTTGLVGTLVSGSFLYLIGIINLVILMGIVRVFRRMRQGEFSEEELEDQLNSRGV